MKCPHCNLTIAQPRNPIPTVDIITEINRRDVKDAEDAVTACEHPSGRVTLLKIWREGGSRYVVVDESELG